VANQDFDISITYNFTDSFGQSTGDQVIQWYNAKANNNSVQKVRCTEFDSTNWEESCVTPDTLITLVDGTQKRVDELTYNDQLLAWNFFTGEYVQTSASYIVRHAETLNRVIHLNFSDGTIVKIVGDHGFYDVNLNKFVFLNESNVDNYIGHQFIKHDGDGYAGVALEFYTVTEEYIPTYSLASIACNNVMANGMFSLTPIENIDSELFFNFIIVGEDMKYDVELLENDIEKYGIFTYEDLSDFMTFEEFSAFEVSNGCYLKIAVQKGYITLEELLAMLSPKDMIQ